MFPLEKNGKQDLKLYLFQQQNHPTPILVNTAIRLGYSITDCKLPPGQWSFMGEAPMKEILREIEVQTPQIDFQILPEAKPMEQGTFVASLKLTGERFSNLLTQTDQRDLRRILNKLS